MISPLSIKWYACCEVDSEVIEYRAEDVVYWRPRILKTKLNNGDWVDASEEAYEGYCFIGSSKGWSYIENVLEVRLMRQAGVPYQFSDKEVRELKLFERIRFNVVPERLVRGDEVIVREDCGHAFSGLVGRYIQPVPVIGGEQARVEFDIFGQRVLSECVPMDFLERRVDDEGL